MGLHVLRVLSLLCCLTLALPPGWCCLLLLKLNPNATTFAGPPRPVPLKSSRLCCCHVPQPQSHKDEKKSETPRTPPLKNCPCSDRHSTPPLSSSVEQDEGGFTLAALLPFQALTPPPIGSVERFASVAHPLEPPIHVRNCVWRC
jgi:hypothetical protein